MIMYKNKAFTLSEILIAMAIIGVTMIAGYSAFRNHEERAIAHSYAKAYKTLATAAYNIQNEVVEFNKKANYEAQENGSAVASAANLKKFPFVASNTTATSANLRTKLMEYINNKGSYSSPPEAFANFDNFIASDGMIYYFDPTPIQKFYVVWVDINGTRHPNTSSARNAKYPDIVPFLVHSELGEVVPAGYPAYNSKYSVSRIIYSDPEKDLSYSSVMTFSEAQSSAYGNTSFAQDSFSQTRSIAEFDNTLPEGFVKPIKSQDSTNCGLGGYQEASDFPPCTVQVNTKF